MRTDAVPPVLTMEMAPVVPVPIGRTETTTGIVAPAAMVPVAGVCVEPALIAQDPKVQSRVADVPQDDCLGLRESGEVELRLVDFEHGRAGRRRRRSGREICGGGGRAPASNVTGLPAGGAVSIGDAIVRAGAEVAVIAGRAIDVERTGVKARHRGVGGYADLEGAREAGRAIGIARTSRPLGGRPARPARARWSRLATDLATRSDQRQQANDSQDFHERDLSVDETAGRFSNRQASRPSAQFAGKEARRASRVSTGVSRPVSPGAGQTGAQDRRPTGRLSDKSRFPGTCSSLSRCRLRWSASSRRILRWRWARRSTA